MPNCRYFNFIIKNDKLKDACFLKYVTGERVEIFSQIIGDTVEQNLRVLQAQRGFVLDSGFQESRKTSRSQVLGCGYGLM